MTKLGKKARKFAKKHLQSTLKRRRKEKSMFKKRTPKNRGSATEDQVSSKPDPSIGRISEDVDVGDISLVPIFSDNESDSREYASDSDGFLSENSTCADDEASESENDSDPNESSVLLGQNEELHSELAKQMKILNRLRKKDPEFSKFLEEQEKVLVQRRSEEGSSDEKDETIDQGLVEANPNGSNLNNGKILTSSNIDSWCQQVKEKQDMSVLPNLLNAYRAACHYGSAGDLDSLSYRKIHDSKTFCKILKFVLHEADGIIRGLLGISSSSCKKENIHELKNTPKWKKSNSLIKCYLNSTVFLLNQVTDSEILTYALIQLRASTIFFAAFPSLQRRLIKVTVQLWATGGGAVSSSSFLIIRDVASISSKCYDTCLRETYKAFVARSKFVDPTNLGHIQFLVNSLVELYSLDVQKSFLKALASIEQLAKILKQGFKTEKKESLKKIPSWQYISCMDLWVKFVSANIRDHDLQPFMYLMVQVVRGVAHLFPGPRYLPLRVKCIKMLNQLSSSSKVFIPISSLVLDSLEYIGSGKPDAKPGNDFDVSSALKVPKQWLKSQSFQEECVLSAIELLAGHFAQWSFHISFPELATVSLIRLRSFHEKLTSESLRRPVKRLIDQVEQNVEFVQKKRSDVPFSPKDQEFVESFLQLDPGTKNAPFNQYYSDVIKKSLSRSVLKQSETAEKKLRKQNAKKQNKSPANESKDLNIEKDSGKRNIEKKKDGRKGKKQRTENMNLST